jgi:putative toxin-antitoxin system antitoxin component (TIGR02293 family)
MKRPTSGKSPPHTGAPASRSFGIELTQKQQPAGAGISVAQVRKGLPMKALDDLANTLEVDRAELAEILGTSLRTLQRRVGDNEKLGPAASDRLARVQRILLLAEHVLGDTAKAALWLTTPSRVLEDTPLRLLDTDIGTQRVQQELHQIEFGMPA